MSWKKNLAVLTSLAGAASAAGAAAGAASGAAAAGAAPLGQGAGGIYY